ncbi:MAG TPA: MFS transporter [Candidatus Binatia bacterium]|jgi:MFS family permease|nr:MFS transporter [Candidatus Binatia bacterium]
MRFSPTPWLVAGIASVVLGLSRGIHSSFGVFNVALLDAFGWSRGATAGIFSIVLTVDAVLSPVVGYLLDRFGPKIISITGCMALVIGLYLSSRVTDLWQLYICFGLILAVGFTFAGMVPHVFLISEWFASNRASAIGVVYAGTGVGIMLLAPLSAWLISSYGWARAFEIYSVSVLIGLLPLVWLFYQHGPYGERLRGRVERKKNQQQWTAKLALQSLQFWLLFIARIAAASGTTVIVTHQVAHVVDVGFSKLLSASIFGLAGITSSFGRVIFGFIADRLSKQAAYTLNIAMTVIGVGALMILRDPSQAWLLYVYVIFFGIGFGSRAVIFSALTADIFSGKGFGSILGYSTVAVGVGGALGSYLGGAFHDWTGSYLVSFSLSALLLALSDVCIWVLSVTAIGNYDKRLWASEE